MLVTHRLWFIKVAGIEMWLFLQGISHAQAMGCSNTKAVDLTNEDLEFLKRHTDYDDATIRDWYAGFKVGL